MVWLSSIKAKISSKLLDEEFLKQNVLHQNHYNTSQGYQRRVLGLYKPQRFLDQLSSNVKVGNFKCKMNSQKEKAAQSNLLGLVMKSSGHEFVWNMAGGQIKRGVNVE